MRRGNRVNNLDAQLNFTPDFVIPCRYHLFFGDKALFQIRIVFYVANGNMAFRLVGLIALI